MKLFSLLIITFLFSGYSIYSQNKTIDGEVLNTVMDTPLPYVNIGIANKNVGTVSDIYGKFSLKLNDRISESDTVIFSHIGFGTKKVVVSNLNGSAGIVSMEYKTSHLNEVIVETKMPKPKKIGRHSKGLGLTHANFYTYYDEDVDDKLSREKGMKLKINKNCRIKDLNFNITGNDFRSLKFRVNFYKIENGLPTEIIVNKNIIFEIKDGFLGWFTINLEPYDIYFEKEIEEIAVTIQWVESVKTDKKSKYFSISTAASPVSIAFFRDKAMDIWTKSGQSMSFYLNAMCN